MIKMEKSDFTYIDLFAGIGGFHIACKENNGKCVFASEIDKKACKTYKDNHGMNPYSDITKQDAEKILDFDLLCAGFPCQSFSMVGKRLGFEDTRGTLIYDVIRILKKKRPKAFILENVQGLLSHDEGRTFYVIRKLLGNRYNKRREFFNNPDSLEYNIFYKVLNSAYFGLAQNRKRIFSVGFRKGIEGWKDFKFPKGYDKLRIIKDVLEKNIDDKYYLSKKDIRKLLKKKNRANLKDRLEDINKKSGTIIASYGSIGSFGSSYLNINNKFRMFTPRECARLQGFPESFKIHEKDNQAYRQFGNAVSPPVVKAIIKEMKKIFIEK
ncbi:hypothetical protein LCGC14_2131620 [marine sediment metagenome]|uniref:DNA (cytosine-5-)-methyltransferase n=1 Tax=marine sediment metagenome TaxID=412755 RepID=A0A0F9E1A4_9ZZZZ